LENIATKATKFQYSLCEGVLVVINQEDGFSYFHEYAEEDEALDILNELCEQGKVSVSAEFVEVSCKSIVKLLNRLPKSAILSIAG
jgi:hypothetical protein